MLGGDGIHFRLEAEHVLIQPSSQILSQKLLKRSLSMRLSRILFLAISAFLLLGCGTKTPSTSSSSAKIAIAKEKIGDAANATAEAAMAKRDEYAREIGKQLDALNVKYEELKGRAAKADAQAKQGLEKKLEEAKVKRDAAAKKLDELKDASADRWEKVKEGVGSAIDDLKKIFD